MDIERAMKNFDSGYTCCQSVLSAFCTEFGLNERLALKLGEGMCGGVANRGHVCGAVSGGVMAIGLAFGRDDLDDLDAKAKTIALARRFQDKFAHERGSVVCREILKVDLSSEEGAKAAREKNLFTTVCRDKVLLACNIVDELLCDAASRE